MKRFSLTLPQKSDWNKVFNGEDSTVTVAVAKEALPDIGEVVRVDLALGPETTKVVFRGGVVSHQNDPRGVRVILGPKEKAKVNFLRGYARDGMLNLRRLRRLPISLHVTYGGLDGPVESYTRDINEEGLFVVSENPLPEESELHLLLKFPNETEPHNLIGRVGHTVVIEDEDIPGMGIVLKMEDAVKAKLSASVDALEKAFLAGQLDSKYLE